MSTRKHSLDRGLSQGGTSHRDDWATRSRQLIAGAITQFKRLWGLLLLIYVPILLTFVVLRIISHFSERMTLSYLTRDVAAIADLPFYAGLVSQLGALVWAASLAICIFTLIVLRKQTPNFTASRRWLAHAAILTAILLFDDVFQFHEEIGEDYLGLSEKVIVLGYVGLAIIILFANFSEIINTEYLILGLALFLFGMSVFLDGAHLDRFGDIGRFFNDQLETFAEDGLKFAGIATWMVYFARYGYQKLIGVPQS